MFQNHPSISRWIVWVLSTAFLFLMSAGLALQIITEVPFSGIPLPVHFLEGMILGVWMLVGALLASRQPRHPVGWIWILMALAFAVDHFTWGYAVYSTFHASRPLPGSGIAIVTQYFHGRVLGGLGIMLLFLLFPSGKLMTRRWGLLVWIALITEGIALIATVFAPNPVGSFPFRTDLIPVPEWIRMISEPLREIFSAAFLLCILAASTSLLLRLYRAKGIERQQLKWFVYTAVFIPFAFLIIAIGGARQSSSPNIAVFVGIVIGLASSAGIAIASLFAIFRYRLYDIDVIINRTLVYGSLSAALTMVYLLAIIALQNLFRTIAGQETPIAIVTSTLLVAALFQPFRRRIQGFIDRRFYRRKYNSTQVLARMSSKLRDEVDPDELAGNLIKIVEESIQPKHISLWMLTRVEEREPQ